MEWSITTWNRSRGHLLKLKRACWDKLKIWKFWTLNVRLWINLAQSIDFPAQTVWLSWFPGHPVCAQLHMPDWPIFINLVRSTQRKQLTSHRALQICTLLLFFTAYYHVTKVHAHKQYKTSNSKSFFFHWYEVHWHCSMGVGHKHHSICKRICFKPLPKPGKSKNGRYNYCIHVHSVAWWLSTIDEISEYCFVSGALY